MTTTAPRLARNAHELEIYARRRLNNLVRSIREGNAPARAALVLNGQAPRGTDYAVDVTGNQVSLVVQADGNWMYINVTEGMTNDGRGLVLMYTDALENGYADEFLAEQREWQREVLADMIQR